MKTFETKKFTDADAALAHVRLIYDSNAAYLRECFQRLAKGENLVDGAQAFYPYVAVTIHTAPEHHGVRQAYGFIVKPGRYSTTLTRPDIFADYYLEQFTELLKNHQVPLEVGVSTTPIPIHFAFTDGMYVENGLDPAQVERLRQSFHLPDLSLMDDSIANGTHRLAWGEDMPLALFTAPRVDYSLHRLRHYTGSDPAHFQKFVIFTNYQFYVDEFVRMGAETMKATNDPALAASRKHYTRLIEPNGVITENANLGTDGATTGDRLARLPQMPAYHLARADGHGITMINIGVGPSNARNISDHVAVLRPSAWLMLGHCAGLRETQKLGDYVLAHAYVRDDHALDQDLPLWVPIPALAEVQRALESAVGYVTGQVGHDLKTVMRTGTVVSTDNRNWEISGYAKLVERFNQSRAIALDMESAVIAANGFRLRVPYGTLLCVSDRPLHGEIKLPGMANLFYRRQVDQHLQIGVRAMELLHESGAGKLHSRKLRGFAEAAFR